jgi:methylphosphotriester-DNA--protein-cysteine methyltransferase
MPNHSRVTGRSPRKTTANSATSTTLSSSTGATFEASPSLSARRYRRRPRVATGRLADPRRPAVSCRIMAVGAPVSHRTPSLAPFTYVPGPPLSHFVELFWLYESYGAGHARERILPTPTTELVIDLRNDRHHPVIAGAHSEAFTIDTSERPSILGVHFKPGGAFPFLKPPAGELHNVCVALDALWGGRADELRDRVLEAGTPAAKFRVVEQCLLAWAARPLARHRAVAFALRELGSVPQARPISEVTDQIGLSARRFIQVFSEEVGLTPKLFCRVQRFREVLRLVEGEAPVEWADVALACGYYDQAHFIHDFRAFAGLNPTAYLRARGPHRGHIPLPG